MWRSRASPSFGRGAREELRMRTSEQRAESYRALKRDKSALGLTWQQLADLDDFLSSRYGIAHRVGKPISWAEMRATVHPALVHDLKRLQRRRRGYWRCKRDVPLALEKDRFEWNSTTVRCKTENKARPFGVWFRLTKRPTLDLPAVVTGRLSSPRGVFRSPQTLHRRTC